MLIGTFGFSEQASASSPDKGDLGGFHTEKGDLKKC